jgi:hypothetical protein
MADPPAGEAGFREQFTRFAEEIRHLVNAVFGGDVDVSVTDADHRSQIVADVPLTVEGQNLARLKIDLWCCLDSHQQYLAVEESTYQLVAQVDRAPIFRFEYERAARSKPAAHIRRDPPGRGDTVAHCGGRPKRWVEPGRPAAMLPL